MPAVAGRDCSQGLQIVPVDARYSVMRHRVVGKVPGLMGGRAVRPGENFSLPIGGKCGCLFWHAQAKEKKGACWLAWLQANFGMCSHGVGIRTCG